MRSGGSSVFGVCRLEFTLKRTDMELKNRRWYSMRPKYYLAEYEVRALVGTGLRFQIWGRNGQLSKDHEDIDVQWQTLDATSIRDFGGYEPSPRYRIVN